MSEQDLFATLSFKGERFNNRFMPVTALPSIAAYQDTLVELAKSIWREDNPDRAQLPKNFAKGFQLGLQGISGGSKVAHLPRQTSEREDFFSDDSFQDVFLEAQEQLAKIVSAANANRDFEPLPASAIRPFERLRKYVSGSENIEVDPKANIGSHVKKFVLTESSVSRVVEKSRQRKTKNVEDIGFVVGLLESPASIKIISASGVFTYPIDWMELRGSDGLSIGSILSFQIYAECNVHSIIKKLISPLSISPIVVASFSSQFTDRISGFSELESGWLDGEGKKPAKETIIRARDMALFLNRKKKDLRVYPDVEGGIEFEWSEGNIAASLLVCRDEFLLGASDLASDAFREKAYKGVSFGLLRSIQNLLAFLGKEEKA